MAHDVSIWIALGGVDRRCLGIVPASNVSMTCMRPPQQGQGLDQMARTTRKQMEPRSPFSASATYGESHERARTSCGK
jgi:hypothetical protein